MSEPRRHQLGSCIDGPRCEACGHPLPDAPEPDHSDWGEWRCTQCGAAHCQDDDCGEPCGKMLDLSNECPEYAEMVKRDRNAGSTL